MQNLFVGKFSVSFIAFHAEYGKSCFFAHLATSRSHIREPNLSAYCFLFKQRVQHRCAVLPYLRLFIFQHGI